MLPRLLIIDDLFGRSVRTGRNIEREHLCAQFLWHDATGDAAAVASRQTIRKPVAEVVFFRGQSPEVAGIGDLVTNDLPGAIAIVRRGWIEAMAQGTPPWTMMLLDLCFYTGNVTRESDLRVTGRAGANIVRCLHDALQPTAVATEYTPPNRVRTTSLAVAPSRPVRCHRTTEARREIGVSCFIVDGSPYSDLAVNVNVAMLRIQVRADLFLSS